jgi:hypothetical protein
MAELMILKGYKVVAIVRFDDMFGVRFEDGK